MSADCSRLRVLVICAAVLAGLALPVATAGAGVSVGLASRASATYVWAVWGGHRGPALTKLTGEAGIDAGNNDSLLIEPSGHVLEFGGNTLGAQAYAVPHLSHVVATADADRYFLAISSPTSIGRAAAPIRRCGGGTMARRPPRSLLSTASAWSRWPPVPTISSR